jgi:hypothetical protein
MGAAIPTPNMELIEQSNAACLPSGKALEGGLAVDLGPGGVHRRQSSGVCALPDLEQIGTEAPYLAKASWRWKPAGGIRPS